MQMQPPITYIWADIKYLTPPRTHRISGLKNVRSWNQNFWFKNDGDKWSRIFYFEIHRAPSKLLLPSAKKLAWQVSRYLWRGSVDFKKKSRPFFTIIFKLKNGNFKTRDFSPLIETVLAGVLSFSYSSNKIRKAQIWLAYWPNIYYIYIPCAW